MLLYRDLGLEGSKVVEVKAVCYIVCSCGQKHLLRPGLDAPVYWCEDNLRNLKEGDEVEYEEEDSLSSISETIGKLGKPLGVPLRHWDFFFKTGKFPRK